MRLPLAALLLAAAPCPAHAATSGAPGGELRLGLEAGVTWYGSRPNNGTGPAGLVRARWQPLDRLALSTALIGVSNPRAAGGTFRAAIVPLALEVRVDRAPVSPYVALGYAFGSFRLEDPGGAVRTLAAEYRHGPSLGFGIEAMVTRTVAITGQATYFGFGYFAEQPQAFPFTSAITAGVEACFF